MREISRRPSVTTRTATRRVAGILAILLAGAAAASEGPLAWPQWRGPDGLGVAPETGPLPQEWSAEGHNVRWRAEIPGQGNSSPIAVANRAFVTTAYEGRGGGALTILGLATAAGAALLFLWRFFREGAFAIFRRKPLETTALLIAGGSFLFVLVAMLTIFEPELFYPIGKPRRVWCMAGALGLLGLSAGLGWVDRASPWRVAGALGLVLGASLLVFLAPSGYLGPGPVGERIALVVPGIAAACWFVIGFVRSRRPVASQAKPRVSRPSLALPLAFLSLLVFVMPNFLNGLQRAVVCFDLETGELLWERSVFSAPPEQKWPLGTFATPTPVSDGHLVFAYFGSGLAALDFEGRPIWRRRFPEYARHTRYGASTSLVVTEETVITLQESEMFQEGPPSWIAAFDKHSGMTRWRIEPADSRDSYGTPLLLRSDAGTLLLAPTWHLLAAYDADSGARLWSVEHEMEEIVSSLARADDLIALTGGTRGHKSLMVMRLKGDTAETLWQTHRGVATISSPVLYRSMLFTITEAGIMICYEAESGTVFWKKRLEGEYFSSLLAGDGKVYATNTEGTTTVVAADSEFKLIAENHLGEAVYASPAVTERCLLIRTSRHLYCVEAGRRP